jgi:quinoprotein glucose dehydrogenase
VPDAQRDPIAVPAPAGAASPRLRERSPQEGVLVQRSARAISLGILLLGCAACGDPGWSASGDALAGWPFYGSDAGGTRYSRVDQIDRANVPALEEAWRIRTGDLAAEPPPPSHMAFQATPIEVDGLLVLPTPLGRVLALDPETGQERWRFTSTVQGSEYPEYTSRGVAAWEDPARAAGEPCRRRIFAATVESRLFALDAATGAPCRDFGAGGEVNLREGVGPLRPWDYATSSPPVVAGDLVIVGSAIGDNQRVDSPRGIVRAYAARSGALRWAWDPIPRDTSDPAHAGWDPEAARRTGSANAWAPLSLDAERDLLFVPTSSPSPDYFGGERPGDNRYANSVVALRASSGEVVWHFQLVHHDLWDYDVPAQPTLTSVRRDGAEIPVVVQATKMGHLFVLHRETGEPVFPVEERPMPASDVPGERAWPTQPVPLQPPPLVPQALTPDDVWGLTPWDRGRCRERLARLRNEGIFTPPSLQGTLMLPGNAGGTNWGGVAVDPERRIVVLNATNLAFEVRLIPRDAFEREEAEGGALFREYAPQWGTPFGLMREPILSPLMLPCTPPPWGTLTALSLDTGEILWRRPLGSVPDRIPIPLPIALGLPNLGGPLVTAGGLVFIGAAMDGVLRAFDIETGEERWSDRLPAGGNATPMSYRLRSDGRQFVVIAAGGHGKLGTRRGDYVVAYALPRS